MKLRVASSILLFLIAAPLFCPLGCEKEDYEWEQIADSGKGCFPPNCEEGQFPMAVVPLIAFDGKLYNIGDKAIWTSVDGRTWNQHSKTDWGERYGMRFAFFNNRLWMLGGMKSWDDFRSDIWNSENGIDWKQTTVKADWPPRRGHGLVVFKNRLWILGGAISSGRRNVTPNKFLNDVWSSADGVIWEQVTAGAQWSAREVNTSLVFDDRIWVIGGGDKNDVWSSVDGENWTQITGKAEWSERIGNGGLVFDGKIWIFGGVGKNDVWCSTNGKIWARVFANSPWSTRTALQSVVFKDQIWIFSGKTGREDSWAGDIWAMSKKAKKTL